MAHFTLEEKSTPTAAPPPPPVYRGIAIEDLSLSPANVRTQPADIDDLVASIAAIGLQQNLVVAPGEVEGTFVVVSGSRRLRAMQQLLAEGRWNPEELVLCRVLEEGQSIKEASTAENVIRQDMHPADEFQAFQALSEQEGLTVQDLAARFGKTERYIQQRLKLANVSPKILAELRADKIKLAQVVALAITEDHAAQEQVWKSARRNEWASRPEDLRKALTTKELSVEHDPVGHFLGVADYEAGGGVARKDLFGDEHCAWLPDAKLARRLAKEKLDQVAKKADDGWLWREVRLEFDYEQKRRFTTYGGGQHHYYVDTTKTQWPAAAKAIAGMLVTLDRQGKVEIHRGLVRPEDAKKAAAQARAGKPKQAKADKPGKKPGELSFPQKQGLQALRTAVLRNEIASNPRVALAALAARLATSLNIVEGGTAADDIVRLSRTQTSDGRLPVNVRPVLEKAPAELALRAKIKAWKGRIPKRSSVFAWLLEQPEAVTHELLALCAGNAVMAVDGYPGHQDAGAQFAALAGVDMSNHWAPTAQWLEKQPVAYITAAVTEAHGKAAAAGLAKEKGKAALARKAAQLLAPIAPDGKTPWLPAPLRAPAAPRKPKAAKRAAKV